MKASDAYRVFFPLGMLCGLAGVAIWPLYAFGVTTTYSGRSHAFVQIFGFLYAFVAGFLLTAVPRFTGTQPPSLPTQLSLAGLLWLAAVSSDSRGGSRILRRPLRISVSDCLPAPPARCSRAASRSRWCRRRGICSASVC